MKTFFLFLFLAHTFYSSAQPSLYDSINLKREKIAKTGMVVLGTWSLASVTSGIISYNKTEGSLQQFHRMNAIIGGVNLGLAGITYFTIQKRRNKKYSSAETFKQQETAEKLFLFNTALDMGYVAVGFYLKERANRFADDKRFRLKGAGNALLVQGGFLTLFDAVLYFLNNKNGNRLNAVLQGLSFTPTENGFGLVYNINQ